MPERDIVVIGASAGGVEALARLCAAMPAGFSGAVFVVLHTTASGESRLPQILDRAGPLRAVHVEEDARIEPGTIYVARPNRHMIIDDGMVRPMTGPRRDGHRPSINALFESAAQAYGPRVSGVILSGSLDDGTLGLIQIKHAGGAAFVQSPDEAMFNGMPTSALEQVDVDFTGTIEEIATRLNDMAGDRLEETVPPMERQHHSLKTNPTYKPADNGNPDGVTGFTCPDCGGVLQETRTGDYVHFRCHVGHEVSEKSLLHGQSRDVETAIWTALRILKERIALGQRIEQRAREHGNHHTLARIQEQNQEAEHHAEILQRVLQGTTQEKSVTVLQDDTVGIGGSGGDES